MWYLKNENRPFGKREANLSIQGLEKLTGIWSLLITGMTKWIELNWRKCQELCSSLCSNDEKYAHVHTTGKGITFSERRETTQNSFVHLKGHWYKGGNLKQNIYIDCLQAEC